jgi:hypothetical protein
MYMTRRAGILAGAASLSVGVLPRAARSQARTITLLAHRVHRSVAEGRQGGSTTADRALFHRCQKGPSSKAETNKCTLHCGTKLNELSAKYPPDQINIYKFPPLQTLVIHNRYPYKQ